MKTNSIACLTLIIAYFFFGCGRPVKEENKNSSASSVSTSYVASEKYLIDTKESVLTWQGSSVKGKHDGYVYISKGELMIKNGQLAGGTAEVAMSTIEGNDHRSDNNLINHLKDPDFFDVKKFPFSAITLTKVASINSEENEVAGDLTIKGITHPVSFPAKMEVRDGIFKASGKLVIDRTKWDVRYKSGKFFDNLKDQAISDDIEFHITIVAKI
jgi:polyisoprenoid-binding protein YceI